jgi:hypothetical protein
MGAQDLSASISRSDLLVFEAHQEIGAALVWPDWVDKWLPDWWIVIMACKLS